MSDAPERLRGGEVGAGGYYAAWDAKSKDAPVAELIGFQYTGMAHQADTALSGMWLFLVTELLFFGGLFLLYIIYRDKHPVGFAEASAHAERTIGIINTVLLMTSSAVFSYGLSRVRRGDNRGLYRACILTAALGIAFLLLKGWEWHDDFDQHLFPGSGFAIGGADSGGAQLFWSYYFIATGLHGIHMIAGIGLVGWIALAARRGRFSPAYFTPAEGVGLYWSFVDMVWLVLFPAIYLVGRMTS
jgi:cytochrome c oxidase subunit III